jgi:ABC-type branched-subunit amino acid transport system permease subunit
VGTAILVLIPEFFRSLKMYSPYISAGILLIVVYLMPGGLASLPGVARAFLNGRRKAKGVVYASGD